MVYSSRRRRKLIVVAVLCILIVIALNSLAGRRLSFALLAGSSGDFDGVFLANMVPRGRRGATAAPPKTRGLDRSTVKVLRPLNFTQTSGKASPPPDGTVNNYTGGGGGVDAPSVNGSSLLSSSLTPLSVATAIDTTHVTPPPVPKFNQYLSHDTKFQTWQAYTGFNTSYYEGHMVPSRVHLPTDSIYLAQRRNYTYINWNVTSDTKNIPFQTSHQMLHSIRTFYYETLNSQEEYVNQAKTFFESYQKKCDDQILYRPAQNYCSCLPASLKGQLNLFDETDVIRGYKILDGGLDYEPELTDRDFDKVVDDGIHSNGGAWRPSDCVALESLAIVIPYRDRASHLSVLLNHLHPIMRRQQLDYRIFVIEQVYPDVFNKATIMNIAFKEVMRIRQYDCVIFHDVDMLLEEDRHIYRCSDNVRHMGFSLDKYKYLFDVVLQSLVGGVAAFQPRHFIQLNGYSNSFYGWGGEDNEMLNRIRAKAMHIDRYPLLLSRYMMIKHGSDSRNTVNNYASNGATYNPKQYDIDGLSNVQYKIHDMKKTFSHTAFFAEPLTGLSEYHNYWGSILVTNVIKRDLLNCVQIMMNKKMQQKFNGFTLHNEYCLPGTVTNHNFADGYYSKYLISKRIYYHSSVKDKLVKESNLLNYILISARCNLNIEVSIKEDIYECAERCTAYKGCNSFVHQLGWCKISSTDCFENNNINGTSTASFTNIFLYHRIKGDNVKKYNGQDGDCKVNDIFGGQFTINQCAFICLSLDSCQGFTYLPNAGGPKCWLKDSMCTITQQSTTKPPIDEVKEDDINPTPPKIQMKVSKLNINIYAYYGLKYFQIKNEFVKKNHDSLNLSFHDR